MPSKPEPKILVTGASGFVGRHLVAKLRSLGRPTKCLLRESSSRSHLVELGAELVQGDIRNPDFIRESLKGCETLVHCAAMVSDWGTVEEIREANVLFTQRLVQAAEAEKIKKFVHLSTTDVYGHPGGRKITEDFPLPSRFSNWYAETKRKAEEQVKQSSLDYSILRPATIFGPQSVEVVGEIAKAIYFDRMLLINRGKSIVGLTYVDHVVEAILLSIENPNAKREVFNVSDELELSWREFLLHLSQGLSCKLKTISLPSGFAKILGVSMELSYRALRKLLGVSSRSLLSRQAVQILSVDQCFSSEKMRRNLGWKASKTYELAMKETLDWLIPYIDQAGRLRK